MSGRYASDTTVSVDKSKAEIERTLQRYKATQFAYGWDADRAMIGFRMGDRQYRFLLPLPDRADFARSPQGRARSSEVQTREWEQACRSRWRALLLVIKAQLEAVEVGIVTLEDAFLAYAVLPSGRTVSEEMQPQINEAYRRGLVAPLMLALGDGR
jgi:hypothetical protein